MSATGIESPTFYVTYGQCGERGVRFGAGNGDGVEYGYAECDVRGSAFGV